MNEVQWMDIETAPKDGTRIIVLGPICHWNRDGVRETGMRIYAHVSEWTTEFSDHGYWKFQTPGYSGEIVPTLWMPLPESVAKAFEEFDKHFGHYHETTTSRH